MSEDDVATKLAVHEAVCAERWKQANERLGRIESCWRPSSCCCW
ncbi:hypothetical protein [Dankookia sp. P2]